jgi:hypothetical protein
LLGKGQRVAAVDQPLEAEPAHLGWPAEEGDDAGLEVGAGFDAEAGYDTAAYVPAVPSLTPFSPRNDADDADVAQIDFSAAEFADEGTDGGGWSAPAPSYAEEAEPAPDAPFDQDAAQWGTAVPSGEGQGDVMPERRRRWFK